jgi:hypothetical protein
MIATRSCDGFAGLIFNRRQHSNCIGSRTNLSAEGPDTESIRGTLDGSRPLRL